jgi:SPP1 family predicted phage head-tail adaptor
LGQTLTHRVTVRWRASLDTSMRFKKGARVFAIRGVYDPEDMTRRLVCLCEEMRA